MSTLSTSAPHSELDPKFPVDTVVTATAGALAGAGPLRVVDNIVHAHCLRPNVEVHVEDSNGDLYRYPEALLTT